MFGAEIGFPIALTTVILFEGWRYFPFAFLFLLARLQAISTELYEAAEVDGATPLQRLWYVTLPQLRGVIATLFLLRFIWTFYKFEDIFLLNGGAAGTEVLTVQIFNWLFLGATRPPDPFECGGDPTVEPVPLGCESSSSTCP